MDINIRHTNAKRGSEEYRSHYQKEHQRLQALVITTPIRLRGKLALNVEIVGKSLDPKTNFEH